MMMMRITIIITTIIILIQMECMIIILRVIIVFVIIIILLHPMLVGCWIQHCSTRRSSRIVVVVEDPDPFRQCRNQLQNHIVISMIIIRSRSRIGIGIIIDIVLIILIGMIVFQNKFYKSSNRRNVFDGM